MGTYRYVDVASVYFSELKKKNHVNFYIYCFSCEIDGDIKIEIMFQLVNSFFIILNCLLYKQQLNEWFGSGICQYFIPFRIVESEDSEKCTLWLSEASAIWHSV